MPEEPIHPQCPPFRWRLFPAAAIIAVGVLLLLGNLGYSLAFLDHGNWWAWFILVAALAPLSRAWEIWHRHGRIDAEVVHYLLAAAAVVLVAVMFLANLDWGTWWPLFVILGGLFTLAPRRYRCYGRDRYWRDGVPDDAAVKR